MARSLHKRKAFQLVGGNGHLNPSDNRELGLISSLLVPALIGLRIFTTPNKESGNLCGE